MTAMRNPFRTEPKKEESVPIKDVKEVIEVKEAEPKKEAFPQRESVKRDEKAPIDISKASVVTLLNPLDAYISETIKTQPEDIETIDIQVEPSVFGVHRLSLPEFFEEYSYDCTRGIKCKRHKWVDKWLPMGEGKKIRQWHQESHGKYVFRWVMKHKRAIDEARHLRGWSIVNRQHFPDAENTLFTINGAVEEGNNILFFMPSKKALEWRGQPAKQSQERLKSELTRYKDNPSFYEPKLSGEEEGEGVPLDQSNYQE